ncbi:MAG: hypothetical protein WCP61_06465 [Chitinophagia bacterium]
MKAIKLGWVSILFVVVIVFNTNHLQAQVYTHQTTVIEYLERMAQKGFVELNDLVKPIDRSQVYQLLNQLQSNKNLTKIEKEELQFFLSYYSFDDLTKNNILKTTTVFKDFNKSIFNEPHLLKYTDPNFRIMLDPLGEFNFQSAKSTTTIISSGFQMMGYAGKRIGFQLSVRDVNEQGAYDSIRMDNTLVGFNRRQTTSKNLLSYNQFNTNISYRFNKGMITVGQDQNVLGYGKTGNLVLSAKSPSYPFFRLQYQPTKWMSINYMHAWLQSGVIDSAKTYGTGNTVYGGVREVFVPKFYAIHFVEIKPMKGLSVHFGESIVYTDQLEPAYLMPLSFFKAFDNNKFNDKITTGANGQFFIGVSSRNQIPKTHLYAQLFIDEIRTSSIFSTSNSRNQIAYQLGASVTDLGVPYLTLTAEINKVYPFVYRNFLPAQNYSNSNFPLGDWMGANADRFEFIANYHPKARLNLKAYYLHMAKGGAGTVEQQYFLTPSPIYGFDPQYKRDQISFEGSYEIINNLQIKLSHSIYQMHELLRNSLTTNQTSIGIAFTAF